MHFSKNLVVHSSAGPKMLAFGSHCSRNFQSILDCFITNFKLKYKDSENIKADRVSRVIFNLHQIRRQAFFGTFSSTCTYGEVKDPLKFYQGKDCIEVFCKHIEEEAKRLYHVFHEMPMKCLTQKQWRQFKGATNAHMLICFNEFGEDDKFNYKVRDHHHYMGLYRGPAPRICNLRYKIPRYIPIVFHNLSSYDMHLFIRELGKKFDSGSIGVITESKEKHISFNVDVVVGMYEDMWGRIKKKKIQLRFMGSIRFMASSLDSLPRNLVGENGIMCNQCKSETELTHINENYIAHGMCTRCQGSSLFKLTIDLIFDNLRVGYMDEQF